MTSREFRDRLMRRARRAKVAVAPGTIEALEAYFRLLDQWNAKINLTALPLRPPTDETFDRLFIEPLAVAPYFPDSGGVWIDVGSGGGSPAIPLKVTRPPLELTMVESKTRKAAFLREAIRSLNLPGASVENVRIEALTADADRQSSAAIVTVRAVKTDVNLLTIAATLLREGGKLLLFRPSNAPFVARGFEYVETVQLTEAPCAFATIFRRLFRKNILD